MAELFPKQCTLPVGDGRPHRVTFHRENRESGGREFSVTIEDGATSKDTDNSWGEFLDKEEVAVLHLWLGQRLKELML